jgi:hypothetical protein
MEGHTPETLYHPAHTPLFGAGKMGLAGQVDQLR